MSTVTSADGTSIAYDRSGAGPAVILIGGAFNDRSTTAALAAVLEPAATVYNFDRRGRGASGDTAPYAVQREIEDLAALIGAAGGSAALFGHSSGAVLALEAVMAGLPVSRVAVYEPAWISDGSRPRPAAGLAERAAGLVRAGQRGEVVRLFLTEAVGVPAEVVQMMAGGPDWAGMEALAHTLPYDLAVCGPGQQVPAGRLAGITVPSLVLGGSETFGWLLATCRAVAAAIPGAELAILPGEDHAVLQRPAVLGPVLGGFLVGV